MSARSCEEVGMLAHWVIGSFCFSWLPSFHPTLGDRRHLEIDSTAEETQDATENVRRTGRHAQPYRRPYHAARCFHFGRMSPRKGTRCIGVGGGHCTASRIADVHDTAPHAV